MNEQNSRTSVVPPLTEEVGGSNVQVKKEVVATNLSDDLVGKQYVTFDDFLVKLEPVPKLWKSRDKLVTIKPLTKGDRDEIFKPLNSQKITPGPDGSTTGFWISLELFDEIKKGVVVKSLSHYVGSDGKPVMTKEKLQAMDTKSYEELSEICMSVNKIDFFEANTSDVAAAADIKN